MTPGNVDSFNISLIPSGRPGFRAIWTMRQMMHAAIAHTKDFRWRHSLST
jgi:hypothetical protein